MAISSINHCGFLSSAQVSPRLQTATEKEVSNLRREQHNTKTLRDYAGLPHGYTVLPSDKLKVKGYTVKDLFTAQYKSATTLSDGSKLIRPVRLALGRVDIIPTGNKEYEIIVHPEHGRSIHTTMSEEELLSNKALCSGTIKPSNSEKDTYVLNFVDQEGEEKTFMVTEKGCLKVLEENLLYM